MKLLKRALMINIAVIILCGFCYPLIVTGIGQLFFKKQANGSMIVYNGREAGSSLIGQNFTDPRFFHGRVSSVNYNTYTKDGGNTNYKGVSSGSQNIAPSNKLLEERVQNSIDEFLKTHPGVKKEDIPTDLLTSSGSGLDPDISVDSAKIQIPAVSKASGISESDLLKIVNKYTSQKTFGILGEERVNVLKANIEIASMLKIK